MIICDHCHKPSQSIKEYCLDFSSDDKKETTVESADLCSGCYNEMKQAVLGVFLQFKEPKPQEARKYL